MTRYSLSYEVVDLIAFCTKNPAPMLPHMDVLKPYGQYWFVTITPYGKDIEPNVPDKQKVMEDFKKLSDIVGVDSVGWRYDPIFVDDKHSVDWHITQFEQMAAMLSGYTKTCVISFIDIYKKVERNFPEAREVIKKDRLTIGKAFIECACLLETDIGAYDTCGHLCRYCYANTNAALVKENVKNHYPKSSFLIGNSQPWDVIHEAKQKSWLDLQMRLEI